MGSMGEISHCLFDMDGLLLDTETLYTVAQQQIVSKFGKEFTWELKFLKQREEVLDVLFATAPLLPGVERLLRHLHTNKVPMAVATSSHKRHFDLKTSTHQELFSLFHHVITGDQFIKGKPDPEIFLLASSKQLQT
eukprot:gene11388-12088_t